MESGLVAIMPNRPKKLSEADLMEIESMAGLGMRHEDIAEVKNMCADTLRKYAGPQLKRGKALARAQVMQAAFKMAISGKHTAMTMFWLKTQARWRETGGPVEKSLVFQDLAQELLGCVRNAKEAGQAIAGYLAEVLAAAGRGEIDAGSANSVSRLANVLLKAVSQGKLEERLQHLESTMRQSTVDWEGDWDEPE